MHRWNGGLLVRSCDRLGGIIVVVEKRRCRVSRIVGWKEDTRGRAVHFLRTRLITTTPRGYCVVGPRCLVFFRFVVAIWSPSDPDKMRLRLGFSVSLAVCVMLALCVVLLAVNVFELNWIQYEHNRYHHGREPYITDLPPSSPSTSSRHGQAKRPASYIVLAKHVRYHHLYHKCTIFPLVIRHRQVDASLSIRSDHFLFCF